MPTESAAPTTALVFLPGLPSGELDQSARGIAERLCYALNLRASDRPARFRLGSPHVFSYGGTERADIQPIVRVDEDEAATVQLDVVVLPYFAATLHGFSAHPTWRKMLRLLAALVGNLPAVARALVSERRGKALPVVWAGAVFGGLGVYFLALGLTLLTALLGIALSTIPELAKDPSFGSLTPYLSAPSALQWFAAAPKVLAVMTAFQALVGRFVPDRKRAAFDEMTTAYACLIEYMSAGHGRPEVTSHLQNFLESLHDGDRPYDEVHVVGYSFGAVVALDSLFPVGSAEFEPPPVMRSIRSLSTIGCPFDVLSAFWPGHFRGRVALQDVPELWANFTIRHDPLGSTFAHAGVRLHSGKRTPDITYEGASWGQVAMLGISRWLFQLGQLNLHSRYWYANPQTRACFDPLVAKVFSKHPILNGHLPPPKVDLRLAPEPESCSG